ncbi:phosphatase PAP2 family protein [Streptomyces yaizuensis]|uniref:Phosphatase PAP2 family protein n=1 Tax=Streptomyces yaizuensis TaxID=2989713 RepID=A0ABQ5P0I8_9ACTN|nr:phosphatase PAP2 family protein [Streptomyces sp. YSPA8]GLF96105.1 phosphatase PAP2 family protein [Streptomyces sp. YSPA8]
MDSSLTRGLYRDITDLADSSPSWVQTLAEIGTEAGIVVFAALFVAVWWRARRGSPAELAIAVLGGLGTAVGYVVSESLKTVFDEERPCRAVADAAASLAACPPTGDWSFPSNHSAIAGGAAVALALARPRLVWLTAPLALLMAFSRVFVGVHYPHDVAVGLVVGAVVAAVVTIALTGVGTTLAGTVRTSRSRPVAWLAGPGRD